jgi:pilus assembly protein CpaF
MSPTSPEFDPEAHPVTPADPGNGDGQGTELVHSLRERLVARIGADGAEQLGEAGLRRELAPMLERVLGEDGEPLDPIEQEALVIRVLDELLGSGPLEGLMSDHEISDILINGPRQVFFERRGQLYPTEVAFRDEQDVLRVVRRLLAISGHGWDEKTPLVDARLVDGSRLNFVAKPPALNGPLVSIRRFGARPLTPDDLLANGSLAPEMLDFLAACVKARVNVVISGGTGSGKTTLLNALSRYISRTERIVTIEDTAELELQQAHVAKMEARGAGADGGFSIRDLLRNSLRMRPDRIIVGECRGAEVLDMLQAMNTGHEGSLTTIHGNSAREALSRIELMIGLAGVDVPPWAVRKLIASSVNLVVQVSRLPGGRRKIVTVAELIGTEGEVFSMQEIFEFVQTGVDQDGAAAGFFRATGVRPRCLNKVKIRGGNLPVEMFAERPLGVQKARERGQ